MGWFMEARTTQEIPCPACSKQYEALKKLWSQVTNRPHPTEFRWHCSTCGEERKLIID